MRSFLDRHSALPWVVRGLVALTLLFGFDALMVIFGVGITVHFAGVELRSTTIEFPVIAFLVSGLLALCSSGNWKEALMLCIAIIFAAGLGEFLLRIIDHPLARPHVDYAAWYKPSDYYGHELVAKFEGFGPLNVPVTINDSGFRDRAHAKEKPPGVVRILGLGDSFMFGWGVQEDETFLKELETRLQGRIDRSVETINTGVPGWGLNQYYLFLKQAGMQLSPDLVVLAYFVDDLNGPPQDRIAPVTQYADGLQYKGDVMHHSRLFNFLKSISHLVREKNRPARVSYLHDLDARRREWSQRAAYLMSESTPEETERYTGMLRAHLTRLKSMVNGAGSEVVILYVPDISQLHHPEAQLINRVLLKMCEQLLIPFVDMTPIFEQSKDVVRYYLWPKDPHINRLGHEEIAATLEQEICALPSWKAGCKPSMKSRH
jgi:GDSL-like lipase/acylhydrolase family protein